VAPNRQVIADTTAQPRNVMFPTDAKLLNRAREKLVRLAKQTSARNARKVVDHSEDAETADISKM